MKRTFFLILWLLAGAFALRAELTVLCTTDVHGEARNYQALGEMIERERQAAGRNNTLWIDCGDTVQGTYTAALSRGEDGIAFLNTYGCDIWVPGNHDFEFGMSRLLELIRRFHGQTLGADWELDRYRPEGITEVFRGGKRIVVIGISEPLLTQRVLPDLGFRQRTIEEALSKQMEKIREREPDLVILAIHCGRYFRGGNLAQILRKFPEIDLVLGGHTHQEEEGRRIGRAWYVQAGCRGEALGVVKVELGRRGSRPRIESRLEETPRTPHEKLPRGAREVLAESSVPLCQPGRREYHSPLGELAALALITAGRGDCSFFGCSPASGTVPSYQQLSPLALYELFPYENRVSTVRLTPEELKTVVREALELSRTRGFVPSFAGLKVDAVTGEVTLPEAAADGLLTLAVPDYLLAGNGGLLPELGAIGRRRGVRATSQPLREAVLNYLRVHQNRFEPSGRRWLIFSGVSE